MHLNVCTRIAIHADAILPCSFAALQFDLVQLTACFNLEFHDRSPSRRAVRFHALSSEWFAAALRPLPFAGRRLSKTAAVMVATIPESASFSADLAASPLPASNRSR